MSALSMTGFGNESLEVNDGRITIEIKSLNNKYFDCVVKIPDHMKAIEPSIKEMLTNNIRRGKVEIKILTSISTDDTFKLLDVGAIKSLVEAQNEIKKHFPLAKNLSVYEIMNSPLVINFEKKDYLKIYDSTLTLTKKCIDNFISSCSREGNRLESQILTCITEIEKLIKSASKFAPEAKKRIQSRIKNRLLEATTEGFQELFISSEINDQFKNKKNTQINQFYEFVEERLRVEAALATSKIDVAEELERLLSHVIEIRRIFSECNNEAIGKRLDFIAQEMHREANTIGSKSTTVDLSKISIEMRLLIDQIKEQVQNIQ